MATSRWNNLPLAVKLAVTMTLLVVIAVVGITMLSIRREQQAFRSELKNQASLVLDGLAVSSADALYMLDTNRLATTVTQLKETPSIRFAHFYDEKGRLIGESVPAGTDPLQVDSLGARLLNSDDTIFEWRSDYLLAGESIVVEGQQLGAISIGLSTQSLNSKIAATRNQGILIALIAAAMGALMAFAVSKSITTPLQELVSVTKHLAGQRPASMPKNGSKGTPESARDGRGFTHATVKSRDEVGQLAQSFNEMVSAIQKHEQELRDQAESLRVATAKAKEAARVKGEFLANMSHELRTPLNAIIGFSDMLLMGMGGELTEKQRHKVGRLRDNGTRLLNLVNDILDVTRIEAQRIELVPRPFSPREIAERLTNQMKVLAEQKGLEFRVGVDPELPQSLVGDQQRIEQVIVNLLSNAFKFTERGSVFLEIAADRAAHTWSIAVMDSGIGIPPHAREIIFEEFRQLDGGTTRAYKGSGLGLAITRNLVRIMDGRIDVASELGKGSTFTVTLPLVVAEEEPTPEVYPQVEGV
jgi:signal transduction histidine kinase